MRSRSTSSIDERIDGTVVRPGDLSYDELRRVFNGMIDRKPALIARCTSAADVVEALAYARREGLEVSVRAGGHGVTGSAVIDGALCIDVRPMKKITLDAERGRVVAEAGVNWGELDAATQTIGKAVTGGRVRDTGIAGLILGSGSGWLERKLGFTCDSLLSVEIVIAGGKVLIASETENADLFWGVRGGGGNFGIVTKFELQLHDVGPQVYGGMVLYPPFQSVELVRRFRDFMTNAPDEVGGGMAFISAPDAPFVPEFARGRPVISCVLAYFGDPANAEEALRPMREFGPPVKDMVGPISYVDLQGLLEPGNHSGMQNYWKAELLRELPDAAIEQIVRYHQAVPSRFTQAILMPMGGALARVDDDAMAFGQRDAPFNFHILSIWDDRADSARQIQWTRDLHAAIHPYSTGGAFLNFVGDEGAPRVKAAFGPKKWSRLVALKRQYDPKNVFRHNQNIPPHDGAPAAEARPPVAPAAPPPPATNGAPPPFAVLEMLNGMWIARSVQVAANLKIADLLADGPRSVADLATASGTDAGALGRLLHALSTVGVFAHHNCAAYAQTPLSAALAANSALSVGAAAQLFGTPWQWNAWSQLEHSVRTGGAAFDAAHGVDLVRYLDEVNPQAGELFDSAMAGLSGLLNRAVLAAYDFAGSARIADVSGGHSTLLLKLLEARPELTGVLLDRRSAADKFRKVAAASPAADRIEVVVCDYRESLPQMADTMLLNRVLHDWDDDNAARVLRACRAALKPGGRIVVVEQLLGDDKRAAFLDLQMLVLRGGRERSLEDVKALFDRCGFTLTKTVSTASPMSVLIGQPKEGAQ